VDLNLDTLKREILEQLETDGFAVFRGTPGGLENLPIVLWDSEKFPDYTSFLDVARKAGTRIMIFATAEFQSEDIDDLVAQVEECDMTRDERRDFQRRLRDMRIYEGVTCTLELAFDYDSRMYVFEIQPDWYDDFLTLEEEIMDHLTSGEEFDEGESLGGYFSKN
jgi:hypothetical protein